MDDQTPPPNKNEPRTSTELDDDLQDSFLKGHESWTTESDEDEQQVKCDNKLTAKYSRRLKTRLKLF